MRVPNSEQILEYSEAHGMNSHLRARLVERLTAFDQQRRLLPTTDSTFGSHLCPALEMAFWAKHSELLAIASTKIATKSFSIAVPGHLQVGERSSAFFKGEATGNTPHGFGICYDSEGSLDQYNHTLERSNIGAIVGDGMLRQGVGDNGALISGLWVHGEPYLVGLYRSINDGTEPDDYSNYWCRYETRNYAGELGAWKPSGLGLCTSTEGAWTIDGITRYPRGSDHRCTFGEFSAGRLENGMEILGGGWYTSGVERINVTYGGVTRETIAENQAKESQFSKWLL